MAKFFWTHISPQTPDLRFNTTLNFDAETQHVELTVAIEKAEEVSTKFATAGPLSGLDINLSISNLSPFPLKNRPQEYQVGYASYVAAKYQLNTAQSKALSISAENDNLRQELATKEVMGAANIILYSLKSYYFLLIYLKTSNSGATGGY